MKMFLIFLAILVTYAILRFLFKLDQDKQDLKEGMEDKFSYFIQVFYSQYSNIKIVRIDNRTINIQPVDSPNYLFTVQYITGYLHVDARFKYFQNELHEKYQFPARNLNADKQVSLATGLLFDFSEKCLNHQTKTRIF